MLTNNFSILSKIVMLGSDSSYAAAPIKEYDGNTFYIAPPQYNAGYPLQDSLNSMSTTSTGVQTGWSVGTGNTPPSATDYQLENRIDPRSTLSATINSTYSTEANKFNRKITMTLSNISADNVTINEIGWVASCRGNATQGQTSLSNHNVLMFRHVFDESIVLTPGDYATILITFSADYSIS